MGHLDLPRIEPADRLRGRPRLLVVPTTLRRQRWKLPVGAFIEQRYRRRFGGDSRDHDRRGPEPSAEGFKHRSGMRIRRNAFDPTWQMSDLVCYLMNLADDLQAWLEQGAVAREVLSQVSEDLREIAKALDTGTPISPILAIPVPTRPLRRGRSRRGDQERTFDDDEIPF